MSGFFNERLMRHSITTRLYDSTSRGGVRIVAKTSYWQRGSRPYEDRATPEQNHRRAANALIARLGWGDGATGSAAMSVTPSASSWTSEGRKWSRRRCAGRARVVWKSGTLLGERGHSALALRADSVQRDMAAKRLVRDRRDRIPPFSKLHLTPVVPADQESAFVAGDRARPDRGGTSGRARIACPSPHLP